MFDGCCQKQFYLREPSIIPTNARSPLLTVTIQYHLLTQGVIIMTVILQ